MRGLRQAAFALILWALAAWVSTTHTKPIFVDCYPQATWDGKRFIPTGAWVCLR